MGKVIRFDYFKVYANRYNQERDVMAETICDLTQVLAQIMKYLKVTATDSFIFPTLLMIRPKKWYDFFNIKNWRGRSVTTVFLKL